MPPRRSPPPPDPERLSRLLAAARATRIARASAGVGAVAGVSGGVDGPPPSVDRDGHRGGGWVPASAPPDADTSWVDDPWGVGVRVGPGGSVEWPRPEESSPTAPPGRHRSAPRVLTVPTPLRGARLAVPWRAVVAALVVLVVAAAVFAVRVARAQEGATPQLVGDGGGLVGRAASTSPFGGLSSSGLRATGPAGSPSAGNTSRRQVVVDVVGEVAHPGVVTVVEGARVGDVLTAAGGPLSTADIPRLNLARVVVDGEQLVVPRPGETGPFAPGAAAAAPGGSVGPSSLAVVDLNRADLTALDGLPGVGPVLAQRILDWRVEHGRFSSVDELGEVSGIGDKLLSQLRSKVRV